MKKRTAKDKKAWIAKLKAYGLIKQEKPKRRSKKEWIALVEEVNRRFGKKEDK